MLRRLRTPLISAGGLTAAAVVDKALTKPLAPLTTAAASAGTIGSVSLFQYEIW